MGVDIELEGEQRWVCIKGMQEAERRVEKVLEMDR